MQSGLAWLPTKLQMRFQESRNLTTPSLSIMTSPNSNSTMRSWRTVVSFIRVQSFSPWFGRSYWSLKQDSAVETELFRQAQYINWCKSKLIPDPCGRECRYERIVAYFIENLMLDCNSRWSATAQGYAQSIYKLFEHPNFPIPADISDKENLTAKLIHAQERKETITRCRSPLSKEMYVVMAKFANASDQDSAELVTFDWFNIIKYARLRVAEYAQTTQSKVDEFKHASGNKVVKALVASDWKFYDENGCLMMIHLLGLCWSTKEIENNIQNTKEPPEWTINHFFCRWQASTDMPS